MELPGDPKNLSRRIIELLEADLAADGFELVDVRIFRGGGRHQVRVYVDTAGGINLEGCAAASRTVGMLLEAADLIPGPYLMEVSSPGIRRPLRTPAHFEAAAGQRVGLKIQRRGKPTRLHGRLEACREGMLTLAVAADPAPGAEAPEETLVRVPLAEVVEANLDPDFDVRSLINADRRRRKDEKRTRRQQAAGRKRTRGPGRSAKRRGPAAPADGSQQPE